MRKIVLLLLFILSNQFLLAQTGNIKIGADPSGWRGTQGGFYDYSDPEAVNIKVSVWGFVKYPGRYLIPSYSNLKDLLSYSGGPSDDAHLDDLRLYRIMPDSTQVLIKHDYNALLRGEDTNLGKEKQASLKVGDILLVPGEPRLYFRDYFSMTLSVVSVLISLAILILNITK